MSGFRGVAVCLAVVSAVVHAGPARAASEERPAVAAPYDEAPTATSCDFSAAILGSCEPHVTAHSETGRVQMTVRAASPNDGQLPGFAQASAVAYVLAHHDLHSPVGALLHTAYLDVAQVSGSVSRGPLPLPTSDGWTEVRLTARHLGCECAETSPWTRIPLDGTPFVVPVSALVWDPTGRPLPDGRVDLKVEVHGYATVLGTSVATASLDATLARITATYPEEIPIRAAYDDDVRHASCTHDERVNADCWASADYRTGDAAFRLDVESGVGGNIPNNVDGSARAGILSSHRLNRPVRILLYSVLLELGDVRADGPQGVRQTSVGGFYTASSQVWSNFQADAPDGKQATDYDVLATDLGGPELRSRHWLGGRLDGVQAGKIHLMTDVGGRVSTRNRAGRILATASVRVAEFRALVFDYPAG